MFENDVTIYGKHAKFLKSLTKKISRDEGDTDTGTRIFERYIDVYMNAVIFGLLYSRRAERDTKSKDHNIKW